MHTDRDGKRFSAEYRWATSMRNPRWRRLRRICFAVTMGRCAVVPLLKAHHNDHVTYRNLGKEWPLRDLVPLNRHVHAAVTYLRAHGLKGPVNLILRAAYTAWITAWAVGILWFVHAVGVLRFDVLKEIATAATTVQHFVRGGLKL